MTVASLRAAATQKALGLSPSEHIKNNAFGPRPSFNDLPISERQVPSSRTGSGVYYGGSKARPIPNSKLNGNRQNAGKAPSMV